MGVIIGYTSCPIAQYQVWHMETYAPFYNLNKGSHVGLGKPKWGDMDSSPGSATNHIMRLYASHLISLGLTFLRIKWNVYMKVFCKL